MEIPVLVDSAAPVLVESAAPVLVESAAPVVESVLAPLAIDAPLALDGGAKPRSKTRRSMSKTRKPRSKSKRKNSPKSKRKNSPKSKRKNSPKRKRVLHGGLDLSGGQDVDLSGGEFGIDAFGDKDLGTFPAKKNLPYSGVSRNEDYEQIKKNLKNPLYKSVEDDYVKLHKLYMQMSKTRMSEANKIKLLHEVKEHNKDIHFKDGEQPKWFSDYVKEIDKKIQQAEKAIEDKDTKLSASLEYQAAIEEKKLAYMIMEYLTGNTVAVGSGQRARNWRLERTRTGKAPPVIRTYERTSNSAPAASATPAPKAEEAAASAAASAPAAALEAVAAAPAQAAAAAAPAAAQAEAEAAVAAAPDQAAAPAVAAPPRAQTGFTGAFGNNLGNFVRGAVSLLSLNAAQPAAAAAAEAPLPAGAVPSASPAPQPQPAAAAGLPEFVQSGSPLFVDSRSPQLGHSRSPQLGHSRSPAQQKQIVHELPVVNLIRRVGTRANPPGSGLNSGLGGGAKKRSSRSRKGKSRSRYTRN